MFLRVRTCEFASAYLRVCECALAGLRVRTHRAESAHSFFTPSTGYYKRGWHRDGVNPVLWFNVGWFYWLSYQYFTAAYDVESALRSIDALTTDGVDG